ncbi:MAG: hypothetical protein ABTQ73_09375 [Caldilineales bacterium]
MIIAKRLLIWLPAILPLGVLTLFYSYVLRARLALGVWPRPYQPDPKDLGFDLHYVLVLFSWPVLLVSPAILLLWLLYWRRSQPKALLMSAVVFMLIWLASCLLLRLDPGQFGMWLMD